MIVVEFHWVSRWGTTGWVASFSKWLLYNTYNVLLIYKVYHSKDFLLFPIYFCYQYCPLLTVDWTMTCGVFHVHLCPLLKFWHRINGEITFVLIIMKYLEIFKKLLKNAFLHLIRIKLIFKLHFTWMAGS
jgi:hypothetical protein